VKIEYGVDIPSSRDKYAYKFVFDLVIKDGKLELMLPAQTAAFVIK
jgi:hypothetical protein